MASSNKRLTLVASLSIIGTLTFVYMYWCRQPFYRESDVTPLNAKLHGLVEQKVRAEHTNPHEMVRTVDTSPLDLSSGVAKCSEQPKMLPGMMTLPEQEFLKSFIKVDSRYLEWGSGGSTDTFGRLTTGKIVSVENYQPWCDKVTNTPFVKCRQKSRSIEYKCIIPHPTSGAGYPIDKKYYGAFGEYIDVIKQYPNFDIVLVDGRWRVACALFALDYIREDTVVFVHDFHRTDYHIVLQWYDEVKRVDSLVALKMKAGVERPKPDIMEKYRNSPSA